MSEKIRWLSIAICVLCTPILIFSGFAEASLEMPTLHEGDYWNYDMSGEYGTWSFQGTSHDEIVKETTITVEGESYDVWEGKMNMEYTSELFTTSYGITWYGRHSDYALVKSREYTNTTYQGGTSSSFRETIYHPIQQDIDYPIDVGDTWEIHRNNTVTDDTGTYLVPEDTYYECTGKEDVTTDAGTFLCYIIKSWVNRSDTGNYTLSYYSNDIGVSLAKLIMYTNSIPTRTVMLTSYEYTGKNRDGGTPGFEMVVLMGALATVWLVLRERKYKR